MKNLKYAIVGTGAIGGYYGAMLARAKKEVHFLLHSDYEYVLNNGLQIDSVNGDFHLDRVNAYDSTSKMPKCDVVFVCLKTTNNSILSELLPPLLHENTWVVMIQNGIGVEKFMNGLFPKTRFAAGTAFICSGKVGQGHINHQDFGLLQISPYESNPDAVLEQVVADLKESNVPAKILEYTFARWSKCVWNIPFNGLTVVMNATTKDLVENVATEKLCKDICLEVIAAANKCGANIDISAAENTIVTTKQMVAYSPSMKLDYDFHRPMEIQCLYTNAIEEAAEHGADMPLTRMLEEQLRFIQSRYMK